MATKSKKNGHGNGKQLRDEAKAETDKILADTADAANRGLKRKGEKGEPEEDKFPPPKVEKFRRSLRVELKPDEIAESADRAAQMLADRDAKDEEQKAAAKHAKAVIESIDAEIRRLSNEVRTKATYRDVECDRIFDLRTKTLTEKRTDTGETLFERPLTEAECQRELDLPEPNADLDSDFEEPAHP